MIINAWCTIVTWVALISLAVLYGMVFFKININEKLISNAFLIFIIFALGHLILAMYLKCPNCDKRPTVQGFQDIHPSSKTIAGLSGWAVVIINIVSEDEFRCIHCGSDFHV